MKKIIRSFFEDSEENRTIEDGTFILEFPDRYETSYKSLIEYAARVCDEFMINDYKDVEEFIEYCHEDTVKFFGKGFFEIHFEEIKKFASGCTSTIEDHFKFLVEFGLVSEWKLEEIKIDDLYDTDYGFVKD